MTTASITVDEHFQRLIRLLEMEAEAEKQEALQDMQRRSPAAAETSGFTLTNLVIRGEDAGLVGRILLTLGKRNQTLPLPWTRLGSGTPVILSEDGASGWRGVVTRLNKDNIQVAFAQWPESESERPISGWIVPATKSRVNASGRGWIKRGWQRIPVSRICATFCWGCAPQLFTHLTTRRRSTVP